MLGAFLDDTRDDVFDSRFAVDDDGVRRFLERFELTLDECRRHEMTDAAASALLGGCSADPQIDKDDIASSSRETLSKLLPQRGAGNDGVITGRSGARDEILQRREPRLAIAVGEWDSRAHLRDIRGGMAIVRVEKSPPEPFGQRASDVRLTGSGNTHDDDDHR